MLVLARLCRQKLTVVRPAARSAFTWLVTSSSCHPKVVDDTTAVANAVALRGGLLPQVIPVSIQFVSATEKTALVTEPLAETAAYRRSFALVTLDAAPRLNLK